ncbi:Adenylate cyclase [Diplonema papillatum]|nr:Adenylate cyclase [Diplonema papillatum]
MRNRPSGVQRFRIGSPPPLPESKRTQPGGKHAPPPAGEAVEEFEPLRKNICTIQSKVDSALTLMDECESTIEAPEAFAKKIDTAGHAKIERLQSIVDEMMEELDAAKRRVSELEEEVALKTGVIADLEQREAATTAASGAMRDENERLKAVVSKFEQIQHETVAQGAYLAQELDRLKLEASTRKKQHNELRQEHAQLAKEHKDSLVNLAFKEKKAKETAIRLAAPRPAPAVLTLSYAVPETENKGKTERGPEGRLALVFTDIQGSTSLWEALKEKMHNELEKHNDVMRQEIKQWNGYEVKTQGDSFMVAFRDTTDAVCFCLSVQLKLMECQWDRGLDDIHDSKKRVVTVQGREKKIWHGLRVRMGLHVGSPICQIDVTSGHMDYFGPMVNLSARVQGIALGGMISLTPDVRDDIDIRRIPPHLTPRFEPIGTFQLKGISEAVPLQQILSESLSPRLEDFVPLKTRDKEEDISGAPNGSVCVAHLRIESASGIRERNAALWDETLKIFQTEVRASCQVVGGYIVNMDESKTTVAFQHTGVAFRWAMELQEGMIHLMWPEGIDQCPGCEPIEQEGRVVLKGPRVQMGIHACECEASFDPVTKKINYIGPGISVAAALCNASKGGETYVSFSVYDEVSSTSKDIIIVGSSGMTIEGCDEPVDTYFCFPKACPDRANYLMGAPVVEVPPEERLQRHKVTTAPFGRVVLVFTDVQNSTVLWESNETVMSTSVKLHHEWMRTGLRKFRGYEVKTEGDAFMTAFHSPEDAFRWCLYMQQILLTLNYPEELMDCADAKIIEYKGTLLWRGLRVRMGIHIGYPRCEQDPTTQRMDYYGQMVNKAARISGLAQGGQIVFSEEVHAQVAGKLSELGGPVITDGGEVALKGIKKKAKVFYAVPKALRQRNPFKASSGQQHANIDKLLEARKEEPKDVAPTGRVAIAFTDIQNSTVLWERCAQMPQVVQLHHKLMREGIKKFNGYEVKTEGDAFMVAFASSVDGVNWCLSMQEQLLHADWPDGILKLPDAQEETDADGKIIWKGPRVRMGLHVGQAPDLGCEKDECTKRMDYYGKMVNKAARVSGLGKGGEIVISDECYEDIQGVTDIEPYETAFIGEKALKGIDKPVAVYSLVREGYSGRRANWEKMDKAKSQQQGPDEETMILYEKYEAELLRREEERKTAPRGVVTLVFTDVQGSTKLWDTDRVAMAEAVRLHHDVMRRIIKRLGGYEVKTEGDAFMVAFHNPTSAAKWCTVVQRELLNVDWPEDLLKLPLCRQVTDDEGRIIWRGLRVRMGFHMGEVDSIVDETTQRVDYYGPMVNAAARIGNIGMGGEICASFEAIEAINMAEAGSPVVLFLETKALKGISQEFGVFRIVPMDLTSRDFTREKEPPSRLDSTASVAAKNRKYSRQSIVSEVSAADDDDIDHARSSGRGNRSRVFREEWLSLKKDTNQLRDDIASLKSRCRLLEKAEQEKAFEVYRIHKHLRIFMQLIRKYGDCATDRTKGVFSQTDLVHEWIRQHRLIMATDYPGESLVGRRRDDKKTKPNAEMKAQKELAIESQKEEDSHVTSLNDVWQIATSKLSRSVVGHLSKHFFYVHTNLVQPLVKARLKSEQGRAPLPEDILLQTSASRRESIMRFPTRPRENSAKPLFGSVGRNRRSRSSKGGGEKLGPETRDRSKSEDMSSEYAPDDPEDEGSSAVGSSLQTVAQPRRKARSRRLAVTS